MAPRLGHRRACPSASSSRASPRRGWEPSSGSMAVGRCWPSPPSPWRWASRPCAGPEPPGLPGGLAPHRPRHGHRPVRSRLRHARTPLRCRGEARHHDPDPLGRLRQHGVLAALGLPDRAGRLARDLPRLCRAAPLGHAAARPARDPPPARTSGHAIRRRDPRRPARWSGASCLPPHGRGADPRRHGDGHGLGAPHHPAPGPWRGALLGRGLRRADRTLPGRRPHRSRWPARDGITPSGP